MNSLLIVGVYGLLFVAVQAGDPGEKLPGVLDLSPKDFDKYVNGGKSVLVEFYAPWCGHCKKMTPEFKKLGETILQDPKLKKRVDIAKVNADDHKELSQRFGVTGFPTVKWFGKGKPVNEPETYQSARTAEKFLEFINEKLSSEGDFARLEAMDPFAQKFLEASDKKAIVQDATKGAEGLPKDQQEYGQLYIKMMNKALDKGVEYFSTESQRLERMVASGNVAKTKLDEMMAKISVLSAFLPEDNIDEE